MGNPRAVPIFYSGSQKQNANPANRPQRHSRQGRDAVLELSDVLKHKIRSTWLIHSLHYRGPAKPIWGDFPPRFENSLEGGPIVNHFHPPITGAPPGTPIREREGLLFIRNSESVREGRDAELESVRCIEFVQIKLADSQYGMRTLFELREVALHQQFLRKQEKSR